MRAAGVEEWQVGASVGYANVGADGRRPSGVGFGVEGLYGLTDALAARLTFDSSWHPVSADGARKLPDGVVRASTVFAGITYTVDVLRLVPFVDAGVGIVDIGGDVRGARRDLGVEGGLGCEWLLDRHWALAALARYRYFPLELKSVPPGADETPSVFNVQLRLSRLF